MAPHSSTLAWKIPWKEEPGRLQSMGSLRVGHDWATSLSLFSFSIGERNSNPLQCSCLENPRAGGAWWAAVYRVAQSRTRLKRLSSSSSIHFIYFALYIIWNMNAYHIISSLNMFYWRPMVVIYPITLETYHIHVMWMYNRRQWIVWNEFVW